MPTGLQKDPELKTSIEPVVIGFDLDLPPSRSRSLLRTVHHQLRAHILARRLQAGTLLPSSRQLAEAFGFSRNTAVAAYDLLASEGYVVTRAGGGTYVAAVAAPHPQRKAPLVPAQHTGQDARLQPLWRGAVPVTLPPGGATIGDFSVGQPDETLFPFATWRRLSARATRALSRLPARYGGPEGHAGLRQAVAQHVSFARAVACGADDVLVCNGAQQAFDLLARVLVAPGRSTVAVEDPGYGPAARAFRAAGAKVVPVPLDAEGIRLDSIPSDARVVYVTPSHQFPLGMPMSAERRRTLLAWARQHRAVIVEDDYDGEFRFGGRPLDALQTLDDQACVFYVGTFSKSMFPALRLGYLVAPGWARDALLAARQVGDWHGNWQQQETLAAFIGEGHLARHVRRARRVYGQRRAALVAALARHLPQVRVIHSEAGLHLACATATSRQAAALEAQAQRAGLHVSALSHYALGRPYAHGLALGYGRIAAANIDDALKLWARAAA